MSDNPTDCDELVARIEEALGLAGQVDRPNVVRLLRNALDVAMANRNDSQPLFPKVDDAAS